MHYGILSYLSEIIGGEPWENLISKNIYGPLGKCLLTLYSIDTHLAHQQQQTLFENIMGKGEIAHNEQFLLFPPCFLVNQIIVSLFVHIFGIISLFAAEMEGSRIGI